MIPIPTSGQERPNFNQETGYPYGVIQGNHVPELLDDITTAGDDLTWEALVAQIRKEVGEAIKEALDPYAVNPERLIDAMLEVLDDGIGDYVEPPEERQYVHSEKLPEGEIKYLVGWLGGAPLIWVTESPFLAWCRPCSPCVPGAGDLDSLTDREGGILVHSLNPSDFPDELQSRIRTEKDGKYTILWVEE